MKVVQYVLDVLHYKNLDLVDQNGDTALHICAHSGNYRACEILLEVNTKPRIVEVPQIDNQYRCGAKNLKSNFSLSQ
jgi:ankyrin repeat protein